MASTGNIRTVFWNGRSDLKHKHELHQILKDIDVLVCVESWLKPGDQFRYPQFNCIRKDRNDRPGGGIIFLIRKNLSYVELTEVTSPDKNVEVCACRITNVVTPFNIVAHYKVPGCTLAQAIWNEIFGNASSTYPSLIVGDFNAHSVEWNCEHSDSNGNRILNATEDFNLIIHNPHTSTRVDFSRNKFSNIDLVISTVDIADRISVSALEDTLGSDHYPLSITMNIAKNLYRKISNRLSTKRTNWSQYDEIMRVNQNTFLTPEFQQLHAVEKYDIFVKKIIDGIKSSTPLTKTVANHQHRNPVPWWDKECAEIIGLRKAAHKKWIRTGDFSDHIAYKKAVAVVRSTLRRKKTENFRQFAESLNPKTDITYLWNKCKLFKHRWTKNDKSPMPTNVRQAAIEEAISKISPPWVAEEPAKIPQCQYNELFDRPFDETEFAYALKSRKEVSAPGLDGIDYDCLKRLPKFSKQVLLSIFNEMYAKNVYPDVWRKHQVFFTNKENSTGVRPIALSPCICKLFEKLLKTDYSGGSSTN